MTKVEIFHNVAKDYRGRLLGVLHGYGSDHPMVKVFEMPIPKPPSVAAAEQAAEFCFAVTNGHGEGADKYYGRKLRSLSVGDVLNVGGYWFAVEPVGWRLITGLVNDVTDTFEGEHGTQPWKDEPEEGCRCGECAADGDRYDD